ncbi:hypothetical protein BIZ37_12875 [Photobacterium sp. BZF1]|uniref:hypothetical protein n=1 Tax=Photobacterium sp. BZF1 TaxID=1904457 RepID=UPI001653D096|nr:hypothetical protein [Photobacterium sp. BZF1]MBC7003452.1 hypothetical protein [Photobacterium sp. BZF1]
MRCFLLATLIALLGACASSHPHLYSQDLHGCFSQLAMFKQEVNRQKVNDAQVVNLAAFPYLAFDRFSQSQLSRLSSQQDREQWLDYTAQLATQQRQAEYHNLIANPYDLAALDTCAEKMVKEAKHNEKVWAELKQQTVSIPDSYEPWLRVFGLYPISSQIAQSSIDKEKKWILLGFHAPPKDIVQYQLTETISDSGIAASQHKGGQAHINRELITSWFSDALDTSTIHWPQLSKTTISQLYQYYSPLINIETASADDIPGTVNYVDSQHKPAVDTSQPAIYLHHSYTQLYGKIYLQLNYSLWFANRTPTSSFDPYAGKFDGVLLRLTLDHQGRPMLLDSIHHCGCYHMVFNFSDKFVFDNAKPDTESPLLFNRPAPFDLPTWSVTLSHGEHMIKQVGWLAKKDLPNANKVQSLVGHHYDQLRQLPSHQQHTISLFDQRGMLAGSERLESTYLWPFGIPSAGAMRQLGHHAIAFIGIRHFDQPRLFEQILRPKTEP